ncbi:efflux transporter outer membrane subunit [Paraburkholderia susongensis]|uniref:Outer membrane protein, multidrug efflux system n=1 Tax=Paraburkholderia susongensis TaxID=1515439 RepID=A0A1X7M3D3_9BURK|nr:efflux transporter outer membrane subunit [Paraburkholderia susongensis]SMG60490.1 outer membrane protein, multidrug efflux system [Paraburkholderia susongensis]
MSRGVSAMTMAALLCSCTVAHRADLSVPLAPGPFRHAGETAGAPRVGSAWPAMFGDPQLERLIGQALEQNLDIRQANARIDLARAAVTTSRAALVPSADAGAGYSRSRASGTIDNALPKRMMRTWAVAADVTYTVDWTGALRGEAAAAQSNAIAAEADADAAKLRVATEVAADYLTLHYVDEDIAVLTRSVALRETAVKLVEARSQVGNTSDLDVLRARTEWQTTRAELTESRRLRENLVDALAVLLGRSAATFELGNGSGSGNGNRSGAVRVPPVPVGLPADVLTQRPDVYAAGRRLDAAAWTVGVARTAWLPQLTLTADGGFASHSLSDFLDRNSSLWGLAASLTLPLFDGGRRDAALASAQARYTLAEAAYRGVAYNALREAQDALNDIAAGRERIAAFDAAASTSDQVAQLSRRRYALGYVNYFEVVDSDRDALSIERDAIHAREALAVATIGLVRALGGGWSVPDSAQTAHKLGEHGS